MCKSRNKELDSLGFECLLNLNQENFKSEFEKAHKSNSSKVYYCIIDGKIYSYGNIVADERKGRIYKFISRIHYHIGDVNINNPSQLATVAVPSHIEGRLVFNSKNSKKTYKVDKIYFNEVYGSVVVKSVKLLERLRVVGNFIGEDLEVSENRKLLDLEVLVDVIDNDIDVDSENVSLKICDRIKIVGDVYLAGRDKEIEDFYHDFSLERAKEETV